MHGKHCANMAVSFVGLVVFYPYIFIVSPTDLIVKFSKYIVGRVNNLGGCILNYLKGFGGQHM